ncbi:hypothetical protein ACFQ3P_32840 [Paraburkholderia sabiae]|uniref:Uncharacterized protein n=1 Tax=Paraburkholderia sabiae TaxID=273251 RepID=A0ABU9QJ03_9BURK|nr:hypothetical protein [Paraburkholderia sabiae]WJZ79740.1 hypothetical protein QEN71_43665 [Paraburkholderia sabiae]CAD6559400.1 hypothetical protein LMG24235_06663 [Paraburkholderia sabiae]
MDIREIQRLHAQFAPDSMVIDLPRQIAALPAPGDFSEGARQSPLARIGQAPEHFARAKWAKAGPLARGAAIAVAAAAVLGMAGMGAASLYTTYRANHHDPAVVAQPEKQTASKTPAAEAKPAPAFADIDATPAHPVSAAPTLSASDFASAGSLGLTADQFRNSLKTTPRNAGPSAAPAMTTEAQRAAASPIHRESTRRDSPASAASTSATSQQQQAAATVAAPAPAAPAPERAKAETKQTPPAAVAPQAPAIATQPAVTDKPTHPVHRHISRPRPEAADTETTTAPKPAAANRAGSAEVQMF